jgi:membrane protein implicated in regulation of membrane protease activity
MSDWLRWYNLIYLLPAGVAVLVLLMSAVDFGDGGEVDGGEVGDGGDVDGDAWEDGDGGDGEDRPDPGVPRQLLGFLGVGRAPLTIVIGGLLIGWGLFGLGANEMLRPSLKIPAAFMGPSVAIAAAGSLLTARVFAEMAARLMPKDETAAIRQEDLVGLTGKVIYPVSETAGRVHLRDRFRTLHVKSARLVPGVPPLGKGTEVIVVSIDADHRYVMVEPLGFSLGKSGYPP